MYKKNAWKKYNGDYKAIFDFNEGYKSFITNGKTERLSKSIKYLLLLPMLECAFFVDLKEQIIPNRLNMTIFEVGIVFVFLYGINNANIGKDMLLGMLVGGGIFLLITLLGGLIAGKEAMGMGDVKLMGALGLYFGLSNIIVITLVEYTLVYTIIGHPNAILLGFLAAVANLIPYFGGIIVNVIAIIF